MKACTNNDTKASKLHLLRVSKVPQVERMLEADAQRPRPLEHCRTVLDVQVLQGGLALGRLQPAATLGQAAQRVRRPASTSGARRRRERARFFRAPAAAHAAMPGDSRSLTWAALGSRPVSGLEFLALRLHRQPRQPAAAAESADVSIYVIYRRYISCPKR